MTELLETAKELEQSQKDLLKIIPDNMEEWVCFNDPSIDAILRGTLLPKGSQDKYRKMAARVRKEQAEYLASMKEIWRREAEEYDRQNQLDESTDFDDTFDEISDNDFNGIIENNPFTDIEENIEQLKIIQEELPIQSINISQINIQPLLSRYHPLHYLTLNHQKSYEFSLCQLLRKLTWSNYIHLIYYLLSALLRYRTHLCFFLFL